VHESHSEQIKAAELLVAQTKLHIASVKKGNKRDNLMLEKQREELAKQLADLRKRKYKSHLPIKKL
jgi:hypothetical protein